MKKAVLREYLKMQEIEEKKRMNKPTEEKPVKNTTKKTTKRKRSK